MGPSKPSDSPDIVAARALSAEILSQWLGNPAPSTTTATAALTPAAIAGIALGSAFGVVFLGGAVWVLWARVLHPKLTGASEPLLP